MSHLPKFPHFTPQYTSFPSHYTTLKKLLNKLPFNKTNNMCLISSSAPLYSKQDIPIKKVFISPNKVSLYAPFKNTFSGSALKLPTTLTPEEYTKWTFKAINQITQAYEYYYDRGYIHAFLNSTMIPLTCMHSIIEMAKARNYPYIIVCEGYIPAQTKHATDGYAICAEKIVITKVLQTFKIGASV